MPLKINFVSFLGFPLVVSLAIFLALDSKNTTIDYTKSAYKSDFSQITSFSIDLLADFNRQIFDGSVTFQIKIKVQVFEKLYLDMNDENITNICMINNENTTINLTLNKDYKITPVGSKEDLAGSKLFITIPSTFFVNQILDSKFTLIINYTTSPNINGLGVNWLQPSQTFSQKYPFFYTYCRTIKCRGFVPMQDSLDLNSPFTASITVPSPLKVELAASERTIVPNVSINGRINNMTAPYDLDYSVWNTYKFTQNIPITSYLLNVAIGVFEETVLNGNYTLLAEKEIMDNCTSALEKIDLYINEIEKIIPIELPYKFVKFMVMPMAYMESYSFGPNLMFLPYSDMLNKETAENSITSLIFNCYFGVYKIPFDWRDWYLIMGYSRYLTNIVKENLNESIGLLSKNSTLNQLDIIFSNFNENPILTELKPNLYGIKPSEFEDLKIPEFKGFYFFLFLEERLKYNEKYDNYSDNGKLKFLNFTINILNDTEQLIIDSDYYKIKFVDYLKSIMSPIKTIEIRKNINWINLEKEREFSNLKKYTFESELIQEADDLANKYLNFSVMEKEIIERYNGFYSEAKEHFLFVFNESILLNETLLKTLESNYQISKSNNCFIRVMILEMKIRIYDNSSENSEEINNNYGDLVKLCANKKIIYTFQMLFLKNNALAMKIFEINKNYLHPYILKTFTNIIQSGINDNNSRILEEKQVSGKFINKKFREKKNEKTFLK